MSESPRPSLGQELSMRRLDAQQLRIDASSKLANGDSDGAALSEKIAALQDAIADKRVEDVRRREGIEAGTIINTTTGEVIHAPGQPVTFKGVDIDLTDQRPPEVPDQPPV